MHIIKWFHLNLGNKNAAQYTEIKKSNLAAAMEYFNVEGRDLSSTTFSGKCWFNELSHPSKLSDFEKYPNSVFEPSCYFLCFKYPNLYWEIPFLCTYSFGFIVSYTNSVPLFVSKWISQNSTLLNPPGEKSRVRMNRDSAEKANAQQTPKELLKFECLHAPLDRLNVQIISIWQI